MSVTQSYLTLCDPVDCSPPGSSVHGILQARILEWVAMPSRRSSWPRDQTQVSQLQADSLPYEGKNLRERTPCHREVQNLYSDVCQLFFNKTEGKKRLVIKIFLTLQKTFFAMNLWILGAPLHIPGFTHIPSWEGGAQMVQLLGPPILPKKSPCSWLQATCWAYLSEWNKLCF